MTVLISYLEENTSLQNKIVIWKITVHIAVKGAELSENVLLAGGIMHMNIFIKK